MLTFLDVLLFSLHILIIGFNLFGWIIPKFRKAHLWLVGATLFSWLVLGIWKGWGYCILTDWHWDIKRELGERNLPHSFIKYLTNNTLGFDWSSSTVDIITLSTFVLAITLSIRVNFFSKK